MIQITKATNITMLTIAVIKPALKMSPITVQLLSDNKINNKGM
jgi:hypothetical protein